ncbi:ATP-binding cassette domain-containing protein [Tautonia plasticadhaerens]|uniref:G domain-containing protein n=1 Tax=Tautonia plasticadhaerens TaxID=2527974 RepID=A0A518H0U0_9BACT|nr:ABC transporter ATP-binding protein [Tautonia plasticadhaerens]QDV34460.1 hypothetical protein ElP_23490 [Tautonia plasticadhaerens]
MELLGWLWRLFRYRKDLALVYEGGLNLVLGRKTTIAVTGMQGAGKTVLLDHLTGRALRPDYQPPGQSTRSESYRIKDKRSRLIVDVVPGQKANPRLLMLDELFAGSKKVDLVLHIVANGFATIRNEDARRILIEDQGITTIDQLRAYQKARELEDLAETCQFIRQAHRKNRAPTSMLVTMDKVDLYHDQLPAARRYYGTQADSPFAEQLRETARSIGTDFFAWDAIPVCTRLEQYEWNGAVTKPQIRNGKRDKHLAELLSKIKEFCK